MPFSSSYDATMEICDTVGGTVNSKSSGKPTVMGCAVAGTVAAKTLRAMDWPVKSKASSRNLPVTSLVR